MPTSETTIDLSEIFRLVANLHGDANLCLPLYTVSPDLQGQVIASQAQAAEWRDYFASIPEHDCDLPEGLANLPVDTSLLSDELKRKILQDGTDVRGCLIQGDNQTFLRRADLLKGKVRLLYLDPPYNTGNKQHLYKDVFHREDWLLLMRNCLTSVLPFLTKEGSICVSIDDSEMPYLRVLLDEIVGEEHFVACVAYERSGSAGLGQGGVILNTKEYILVYSLDKRKLNDVGFERPLDKEVMKRYCKVLENAGQRILLEELQTQKGVARLYRHEDFSIASLSLRDFERRQDEVLAQYMANFDKIFRNQNVQKENQFQNNIISRLSKDCFYSLEYIPSRGRYKGTEKTLYYWNGELCAWLKDSSTLGADGITKRNKLTDFWSHAQIPKADLANEGGVLFSRSKKAEHLLRRLILLTTNPGDLVLDLFLGSATTAAVAHKTGRYWIGTECGDHFNDCSLRRMKNVIAGDATGVSRISGWHGGGSFIYVSQ